MKGLRLFFGYVLLIGVIAALIGGWVTGFIDMLYKWGGIRDVVIFAVVLLVFAFIGLRLVNRGRRNYFSFIPSDIKRAYVKDIKLQTTILLVTWQDRPFIVSRVSDKHYKVENPFKTRFQKGQVIKFRPKRSGVVVEENKVGIKYNECAIINDGIIGKMLLRSTKSPNRFVNVKTSRFVKKT